MSAKFRAYLDLVRIPNVITAAADILAGFFYVDGSADDWRTCVLLIGASCSLYAGGVALNDVCDVEHDMRERAGRPIPSGRISRREAAVLSTLLLVVGFLLACASSWWAAAVGGALLVAIVLYNGVLKRTAVAPTAMGVCRALNLILGMSVAPRVRGRSEPP